MSVQGSFLRSSQPTSINGSFLRSPQPISVHGSFLRSSQPSSVQGSFLQSSQSNIVRGSFLHSSQPKKEGYLTQKTLLGRRKVWCIADGSVLAVYKNKNDGRPKLRLEAQDARFGADMRTLRFGDTVLVADCEDEFEAWACCLTALKPQVFDRHYDKGTKLGAGSFSQVCLATRKEDGLIFAVKSIDLKRKKSKKFYSYFMREIDHLSRLDSPYVVRAEDIFTSAERIDIVMEYMDLGTMKSFISKRRLTENQVSWFIYQIIAGLKDLHMLDIIHRDVNLANILLKSNAADENHPFTKVADLGLAESRLRAAEQKKIVGNSLNTAPEVMRHAPYTQAVDLWATGMVCYEMLVNCHPFREIEAGQFAFEVGVVGKVPFPDKSWSTRSPCALDFTRKLLEADEHLRMTADEALNHPFLAKVKGMLDSSSSSIESALSA